MANFKLRWCAVLIFLPIMAAAQQSDQKQSKFSSFMNKVNGALDDANTALSGRAPVHRNHSVQPNETPVDPTSFDISGIRLGMNERQAVTAVTDKFHVDASALKFIRSGPVTGKENIDFFSLNVNGAKIIAYFSRDALHQQMNIFVVSKIYYEQAYIDQNMKTMARDALVKYGNPTFHFSDNDYQWCVPTQGYYCSVSPNLHLYSSTLVLDDPRYASAIRKFESDKLSTKSSF